MYTPAKKEIPMIMAKLISNSEIITTAVLDLDRNDNTICVKLKIYGETVSIIYETNDDAGCAAPIFRANEKSKKDFMKIIRKKAIYKFFTLENSDEILDIFFEGVEAGAGVWSEYNDYSAANCSEVKFKRSRSMNITQRLVIKVKRHNNWGWHDESWWDFENQPEVEAINYALTQVYSPMALAEIVDIAKGCVEAM